MPRLSFGGEFEPQPRTRESLVWVKDRARLPMNQGVHVSPQCPRCRSELELGATGRLDAWTCPHGHGVGLSEALERAQEDALSQLWEGAKRAELGQHICPMCDRGMVSVTVGVDVDKDPDDASGTLRVTLDVCRDDQFIWFDPGELDEMPQDLPEPQPSAAEVLQFPKTREAYGFVKFLDRVVYRGALDKNAA